MTQAPAPSAPSPAVRTCAFGPLTIEYDASVLRPRDWTVAQSDRAADLLPDLPAGPVLELCCGAGHIGLLAVHGSRRALVAVDASPDACRWTRVNAERNGIPVEVRHGRLQEALEPGELFPLVIADPPWVPHDEIGRFPEDPASAIDGGPAGLDLARACIDVAAAHLLPGGALLLQVGTPGQADLLRDDARRAGLTEHDRSVVPDRGVVLCLRPSGHAARGSR
ncbi:class I SAM-dependent methyltransferase [Nocardioides albidus]|uniref:Class I SAM-dependent methyltransferase n=1 Tax=Nocardioides albidus TaxID=1517589 RepID=A0A5C4VS08_9ACTN|nr:class I SAM-dependent methyltransferase [Nocardioides albidus]TNM38608.1 class I SAM-dependent methyltransferase [Nocardioides albidus]